MTVAANKDVIRGMIEAADRGDFVALAACYADDYRDHATGGSRGNGNKEETLDTFRELLRAFPDIRHTILDMVGEGDKVVLRVLGRGTQQGPYRGIDATGQPVAFAHTATYRLRDRRVVERWADGSPAVADELLRGRSAAMRVVRSREVRWDADVAGAEFWSLPLDRMSLTCFRVEPHARFAPHSHASEQITYVIEGRLLFTAGGSTHTVSAGDAIAIPAWVEHAVTAGPERVLAVDAWSPPPEHLGSGRESGLPDP